MSEQIPHFVSFDDASGKALLAELDRLTTFAQVADWDRRAGTVLGAIRSYLAALVAMESAIEATAQRANDEHRNQSMLRRMLSSPAAVKAATTWKAQAAAVRAKLAELSEELETAIDKTPDSPADQREMLRDLKLAKKELTLQKREANEAMRQVRTSAREKSAKVGTGFGVLLSTPTSRRYSRMAIRLDKEAAVKPHETLRAHLERQILVVDRAIHWVERFK